MGKKIISVVALLLLIAAALATKLGFRKVDTYEVSKIEKVWNMTRNGYEDVRYFVYTDKGVFLIELSGINAYPYGLQVIKELGTFTMETRGARMEMYGMYPNIVNVIEDE